LFNISHTTANAN